MPTTNPNDANILAEPSTPEEGGAWQWLKRRPVENPVLTGTAITAAIVHGPKAVDPIVSFFSRSSKDAVVDQAPETVAAAVRSGGSGWRGI